MKVNDVRGALDVGMSGPERVGKAPQSGFMEKLTEALDAAKTADATAEKKAEEAARGESNLHDVALAMEQADITMRLMVRSREKIVQAYQEIMRMPV